MSSVQNKANRPWQFRLIWLFAAMVVAAVCFALWFAEPPGWAYLTSWALIFILPGVLIAGACTFREYPRAFCIGMAVPMSLFAYSMISELAYFPVTWDDFVATLRAKEEVDTSPFALSALIRSVREFTRHAVVALGFSLIAGILAVAMRWLAIKFNARQA
jgi:hypothetical protein